MSTDETILRYIVPDGSGAMDARLATVNSAGTVTWLHTDHQGSVIATSNDNGEVVEAVSYSPYGEFGPGQSAPPEGSPFGYTGRQFDPETGLYQYRARYFHTRLGVFLSTDPIGSQDDPNLYMYVGNDPVNAADPTGMQSVPQIQARLRREIDREIRAATSQGRYATTQDRRRASALREARSNLGNINPSQVGFVSPPAPEVSAALTEGIRSNPPESTIVAVRSETESSGFYIYNATTSRSDTTGNATLPSGSFAAGHGHSGRGENDIYPGIGDPVYVLQTGMPLQYEYNGIGGIIGFDGAYMTLDQVDGMVLPEYEEAPDWIKDVFAPW